MTISSIGSTSSLLKQLQTAGLSASSAKLVQSDLEASVKATSNGTSSTPSSASVQAAFAAKIDADVSSGRLSASDAAAAKKTVTDLAGDVSARASETTPAITGTAAAAAPAGGGGGGAGGGGDSNKTEVSETITVSGSTMTTVIAYSDGTTSTMTTAATDAEKAKYDKRHSSDAGRSIDGYTSSIEKGSLVNQLG